MSCCGMEMRWRVLGTGAGLDGPEEGPGGLGQGPPPTLAPRTSPEEGPRFPLT